MPRQTEETTKMPRSGATSRMALGMSFRSSLRRAGSSRGQTKRTGVGGSVDGSPGAGESVDGSPGAGGSVDGSPGVGGSMDGSPGVGGSVDESPGPPLSLLGPPTSWGLKSPREACWLGVGGMVLPCDPYVSREGLPAAACRERRGNPGQALPSQHRGLVIPGAFHLDHPGQT